MKPELMDAEILSILAVQDEYPLSAELIAKHVLASGIKTGVDEVKLRIRFMKERGWVDYQVNDYQEEKWFITEKGQIHRRQSQG